jgi:hypothetical protein
MLFAFDITQSVEKGVPYNTRDKSVGVPPLSLGVDSRPHHVAFILDKVTVVQVSLRILHSFSTGVLLLFYSFSPQGFHTISFIYHLRHIFLAIDLIDNTPVYREMHTSLAVVLNLGRYSAISINSKLRDERGRKRSLIPSWIKRFPSSQKRPEQAQGPTEPSMS